MHTEVDVAPVLIPEVGQVRGSLDYLTAPAAGGMQMGTWTKRDMC